MAGPRANPHGVFARLYQNLAQLGALSSTQERRAAIQKLRVLVRETEPLFTGAPSQGDNEPFVPAPKLMPETPIAKAFRLGQGGGINPYNPDTEFEIYSAFMEGRASTIGESDAEPELP